MHSSPGAQPFAILETWESFGRKIWSGEQAIPLIEPASASLRRFWQYAHLTHYAG
jgi:hypothetical protein